MCLWFSDACANSLVAPFSVVVFFSLSLFFHFLYIELTHFSQQVHSTHGFLYNTLQKPNLPYVCNVDFNVLPIFSLHLLCSICTSTMTKIMNKNGPNTLRKTLRRVVIVVVFVDLGDFSCNVCIISAEWLLVNLKCRANHYEFICSKMLWKCSEFNRTWLVFFLPKWRIKIICWYALNFIAYLSGRTPTHRNIIGPMWNVPRAIWSTQHFSVGFTSTSK